uniref:Uncharacterized protein n=1 Tax=Gasterosteus aculeatus TaxID=69293 RepID=G3NBD4_GASAC
MHGDVYLLCCVTYYSVHLIKCVCPVFSSGMDMSFTASIPGVTDFTALAFNLPENCKSNYTKDLFDTIEQYNGIRSDTIVLLTFKAPIEL